LIDDARTHLEVTATTGSAWKSRLMPVLVIVLFITTIVAYYFGKYRAERDWQGATLALNTLEKDYSTITGENTRLKQLLEFEKAKSIRDEQIKRQAYDEVAQTLASTSKEVASLKENIRFYESIISGGENKQGLQIKSLSLRAGDTGGEYKYKVIVVNNDYGKNKSKGKLTIEIEGIQEGEKKTINITAKKGDEDMPLLFKYFQRIDGIFKVPDKFQPQRVHVLARLSGKKAVKIEKWYTWDILLNTVAPD
jgi:hypothetical protein